MERLQSDPAGDGAQVLDAISTRKPGARTPRPTVDALPLTPVFRVEEAGVSLATLSRWSAAGVIERVGHGLYRRIDAPVVDLDLASPVTREPRATICLLSALVHHALVTEIPTRWDLAVPRNVTPPAGFDAVRWHRFDAATFEVERTVESVDGSEVMVGVYSSVRAVVDAFRFPRSISRELAVEALREWLPVRGNNPGALVELATRLPGSSTRLRSALEVLL